LLEDDLYLSYLEEAEKLIDGGYIKNGMSVEDLAKKLIELRKQKKHNEDLHQLYV
jgi:hypothetical protein